jgi:excinuclease ABC subunit C
VLASFLSQYYLAERFVPPEILCDVDFPDRQLLEEWLREKRGKRVSIIVPQRGDKARLLELARKNCLNMFTVTRTREEQVEGLLRSLQASLGMAQPPHRVECFDISNFQGSLAVGAMVHFEDGRPVKDRYRKFRIQTVVGADDFRCLQEVLERRLRKGIESGDLPDLIMVDGGKGQLSAAVELFSKLDVAGRLQVISLAKERRRRGTTERVYAPGQKEPLPLPQDTPESLYLQRIRDEAHRFAIRYHRELRKRATLRTGLEGVAGIGKKRRQALLEKFGTLKNLQQASEAEIAAVVGKKAAQAVFAALCLADGDGGTMVGPAATAGGRRPAAGEREEAPPATRPLD